MSAIELVSRDAPPAPEAERRAVPRAEIVRRELTGVGGAGAMLYDASRAGNLQVPWFEPRYWIAHDAVIGSARGRGDTLFVRSGDRRMVLRHYHRGGMIAPVAHDRYLWTGEQTARPFVEWRLTRRLFEAGLPVPAPIGARYLRTGFTYRGDLITEFLPETESLAARMRDGLVLRATWRAIGRTIRRFHDFGVCHADLNANNLLLRGDDDVFIIDFDRGRMRRRGLWRDANLVRLRRSLEKIDAAWTRAIFTEDDWHGLLAGYRG